MKTNTKRIVLLLGCLVLVVGMITVWQLPRDSHKATTKNAQSVAKLYPGASIPGVRIANARMKPAMTLAEAQQFAEAQPKNPVAQYRLGATYLKERHYKEAEAAYRKTTQLDANDPLAFCGLAEAGFGLGKYEEAIAAADQAIKLKPDLTEAYECKANAQSQLNRYDLAVVTAQQAVEAALEKGKAYSNLGKLYAEMKRYPEAQQAAQKAIELDPNLPTGYMVLGYAAEK
jgi:tetratricopeptide (TPR) repeat protein